MIVSLEVLLLNVLLLLGQGHSPKLHSVLKACLKQAAIQSELAAAHATESELRTALVAAQKDSASCTRSCRILC